MDDHSLDPSTEPMPLNALLRYLVAALLLGAAGFHFGAMGEHSGVSWTHGLFFASAAWAQVGIGVLLLFKPSRRVAAIGILANIAILALWVLTRTVGLAIGGDGTPEAWGTIDTLCALLETFGLVGLCALLVVPGRERLVNRHAAIAGVAAVWAGVVILTSLAFSPAVAATDGHDHSGGPKRGDHSGMQMPMP